MLFVVLAVALALNLITLNQSLWLDEAININVAKTADIGTLVFHYSLGDFHPPLYHIVQKAWSYLYLDLLHLPEYEFIFRIPSVMFGVLTVYILYLTAKKLFDKKTALIAALLLATAPLHIYYSQEARMYMMAAFLTSLSVYFFFSIIKKDKLIYWFGFIISTVLMLYSDYLPYFMLPVYILYLLINVKKISRTTVTAFIPAFLLIAASITPWLMLLPTQLKVGLAAASVSPAWAQVVGTPDTKILAVTFVKFIIGRISIENNFYYALVMIPIGIFVLGLLTLSLLRTNNKRSFLYYWFFLPVIFSFAFAYFIPIFAYFRFIFILPALYLLLASAITIVNFPPLVRILLTLTLLINLTATAIYYLNPQFHREDWRAATNYVLTSSTKNSVVLFESNYTMAPFDYYSGLAASSLEAHGALDGFDASTSNIKGNLERFTKDKDKVYLFQYLSGITDPQNLVFSQLSAQKFINTKTTDFNGVGFVYEFTK